MISCGPVISPLLFHLYPLFSLYQWLLNFIKCFFCTYWGDHMTIWPLSFILLMWCITLICSVEPSLYPWGKSHLIIAYHLLYALLNLQMFCWRFVHINSLSILTCTFFVCVLVWFCYQCNAGLVKEVWGHSLLFLMFWKNWRIGIKSFLNSKIQQWRHRVLNFGFLWVVCLFIID